MFPAANLDNPTVVKILLAAGQAFAEAGYQGSSTKDIARRAGVSKSLLHYHFHSKEHLLFELQSMLFRNVAESVRRMSLRGTPGLETAMAALDRVWRMVTEVSHYIPLATDLWKLAMTDEKLREQQQVLTDECLDLVVAGVHQTLGAEADRLPMPVERFAQLMLSTLTGLAVRYPAEPEVANQCFEDFKAMLRRFVESEE